MTFLSILFIYLALINIAGFAIMGIDKRRAIEGRWRIPEKTFFIVSALCGSLGTFVGMYVFHHKTKHWYFVVFIPTMMAVQLAAGIIFLVLKVV